mmetsp:Transcript_7827/g.12522  ORF Transcript_7827/g.12522 Transcript_7827/m.12522 type:complete len:225 (-) Transcript_7827:151-825(-)|eukprot:CAMPEP_0184669142 /NCGR_PEP_ID=MMETSP0308-20130426/75974_1 /TAXON_ID=38269 /ORGANISM="Gloeochaete witrockiana, Strain SAG 46.84" /LENGTH=224 /DNA_ID=CAMNT_0027115259 /DNA_START=26 /DNA_END=700 /DNA_ORIENTATION=-
MTEADGKGDTPVTKEDASESEPDDNEKAKPEEPQPEHQLETPWVFWYDARPNQTKRVAGEKDAYENNLRQIGKFNSVEGFWRIFNNLDKPSKMEVSANLHIFKEGIKPMWEDPINKKGGKLVISVRAQDKGVLDKYWEDLVLALVGETLDPGNELCGAVASKRKAADRISLWFRSTDKPIVGELTKRMRDLVNVANDMKIDFQAHETSMTTGSSFSHMSRVEGF